jgi:sugar phosphate isomerase/epimerase
MRIIEATRSDAFKLVFDTGNPVGLPDVRGEVPYRRQDALEFYEAVKEHIAQIHVKDGRWNGEDLEYTLPGEGEARVPEILQALLRDGYEGVISIEPHTAMVFHDPRRVAGQEERWDAYLEYGRRMEQLLRAARVEVGR